MQQKKRILVCPLDWGLGHATRCIPIIQLLLQKNMDVLIGGSGRSLELLKKEFPALEFVHLPGYDIQYPSGSMVFNMLISIPKILRGIQTEHRALENMIADKKIDLVISDNRYGLWSKTVKTVFITHQLLIKSPVGEDLLQRFNLNYIKRFTECWIPDAAGAINLSGDLSHRYPLPLNAFFIGPLSRFSSHHQPEEPTTPSLQLKKKYDVVFLISGPEPQRSVFEALVLKQSETVSLEMLMIRGTPEGEILKETKNNLDIISHLNAVDMKQAILMADVIVSRSGYSTLMDLAALNKKAIFVPTLGQTEQEYLANVCMKKKIAFSQKQSEFHLTQALIKSETYTGFEELNKSGLEERMDYVIGNI